MHTMRNGGMDFEVQICFRGGFPLIATGRYAPPEPDVGLPGWYVSDYELTTVRGNSARFLKITAEEEEQILEQIEAAAKDLMWSETV